MARQRLSRPRYSIHDTSYRYVNGRLINPLTGEAIPYKEPTRIKKPNSQPVVYEIQNGYMVPKIEVDTEELQKAGVPVQLINEDEDIPKL